MKGVFSQAVAVQRSWVCLPRDSQEWSSVFGSVALCYCMHEKGYSDPKSLVVSLTLVSNMSTELKVLWSKVKTCVLTSGPETLGLIYKTTSHLSNKANLLLTGSLSDYPCRVILHRKRHFSQRPPCCVFNKVLNLNKLSLFPKHPQLPYIVCLLRQELDCFSVDNSQDVNSWVFCATRQKFPQKIQFIQTLVN